MIFLAVVSNVFSQSAPHATRAAFPTLKREHRYARALLENAMLYVAPKSGIREPSSGYPVEGWNNDADSGLGLRAFTQLTAIGEWAELLANVVAGNAETPYVSRKQALKDLQQITGTLLRDQQDARTGSMGLLGNFLDLAPDSRMGPLAGMAEKRQFVQKFGAEKGEAIWQALKTKGWLSPQNAVQEAGIVRNDGYGAAFFDGPLAPYSEPETKNGIMALLDQRCVTLAFGDNANLSASLGTAIGALMDPKLRKDSRIARVRSDMERFLENQHQGYAHLYDSNTGLFYFGWDATRKRYLGWQDADGTVHPGHMDYMVNEFRGPTAFVIMRFGLPAKAFGNLRFQIKSYRLESNRDVHVLAPWDGSAFQALGLGLSISDGGYKSWQILLKHVTEVEIDYARRHKLPGFLSESYIGEGARYTGDIGISDIAVNTSPPRITHVASLYTLGVAYGIAPEEVEGFLADKWPILSTLMTDHGPWEGYDINKQKPVRIQTTAHTLSLILGLLGTGPKNMTRYLESRDLHARLQEIYRTGENADMLSSNIGSFAWDTGGTELKAVRDGDLFRVQGGGVTQLGVAFVSPNNEGMNLSNGVLRMRYRSGSDFGKAKIQLKPVPDEESGRTEAPIEISIPVEGTKGGEKEIHVTLPATVGLVRIKEVVLVCDPSVSNAPVDLGISEFSFSHF